MHTHHVTEQPAPPSSSDSASPTGKGDSSARVVRYILGRLFAIAATVAVAAYIAVLIANMGGYVDEIRYAQIQERIVMRVGADEELMELPSERRAELVEAMVDRETTRRGLDQPFMIRSFRYLGNALTLNLGRSHDMTSDSGSRLVRLIILERLAPTLLLFATAELGLFGIAIFVALYLSRRYGSKLDRLFVALAPTSAAPSWFYGIFLILIFAALLGWLPFGGMVAAPAPANPLLYALSVMRHLLLPVAAIIISALFLAVYSWRTFFLIYSSEDYVELAKAKGLTSAAIERRYVLRPTLPTIITSFMLSIIGLWTGAIVLERVFNWPGIGTVTVEAINLYDTPVILGTVIVYAYLLGITVFVLDFVYALVDPRIKVGLGRNRS